MHPSTQSLLASFQWIELPQKIKTDVSVVRNGYHQFAGQVAGILPGGPETTVALRRLRDSKDAAVQALIAQYRATLETQVDERESADGQGSEQQSVVAQSHTQWGRQAGADTQH